MFDIIVADINGIFRGLQAPLAEMEELLQDGVGFPRSLYAMRFDGGVVEQTGLGLSKGDPDYPCKFLLQTVAPMLWRQDGMQAVMTMNAPDGTPFYADPRQVLAATVEKFTAAGMQPVLAAELEFFLEDETLADSHNVLVPSELYSLEALQKHERFFDLLRRAAAAQQIELGTAISEYSPGQFEINLVHKEPMQACLDAILFRRLVRCCARACGQRATFMAKPKTNCPGNGMHFHLSIRTDKGDFCFADEQQLAAAVGGVLEICGEAMAFFAPFGNSYRRFVAGQYAPLTACWGNNHRAAAVRLPLASSDSSKRLELRLAGADANPYLVATALLAGAHWGMENTILPPEEMMAAGELPVTWHAALRNLAEAKILPHYISRQFLDVYHSIKIDEFNREIAHISDYDRNFYGKII